MAWRVTCLVTCDLSLVGDGVLVFLPRDHKVERNGPRPSILPKNQAV